MAGLFETRAMTEITPIDHPQLSELLHDLGALLGAAEVHGFLVGQLATGKRFSRSEWLRAANEQADLSQSPDEIAGDRLYDLYRATLVSLQSGEFSFQLLLPEDDEPLSERVENLGQWCQGFLTGFGMAGSKLKIDSELAEALRDISAIAQVGASDDDAQESSETDLFSISEYVRLTAVEIFLNHNDSSGDMSIGTNDAANKTAPSAGSPADLFKRNKLH
jgi:yecA family protein